MTYIGQLSPCCVRSDRWRGSSKIRETPRGAAVHASDDDASCFNVPPVNLIFQKDAPYSEIQTALARPPLEDWWRIAVSVL